MSRGRTAAILVTLAVTAGALHRKASALEAREAMGEPARDTLPDVVVPTTAHTARQHPQQRGPRHSYDDGGAPPLGGWKDTAVGSEQDQPGQREDWPDD